MSASDDGGPEEAQTGQEFRELAGELDGYGEDDGSGELSDDVLFGILKNQRRRQALRYLEENNGTATLSELAEHIAARENDIEVRQLSSDQRKRVYIGLYQCHLPKMDKADVIDFEKNRGNIELREPAERLFPYIEGIESDEKTSGAAAEPASDASTDPKPGTQPDARVGSRPDNRPTRAKRRRQDLLCVIVGVVVTAKLLGVPGIRRIPDSWVAGAAAGGLIANRAAERLE